MTLEQNLDTIQTVTKAGTPEPRRLVSAQNCWNIYKRCFDEDISRAIARSKIQGQIDGNRPYGEGKLEKLGQGWRSNVSTRSAESMRDSNASAYWSLLTDVSALIKVKIRGIHNPEHEPFLKDWADIIAEEYTDTLFAWDDFFYNMILPINEMLSYGVGTVFWTDPIDWRGKGFQAANVLMPPRSRSTLGGINILFVRDRISAQDLFKKIEDEAVAKRFGWNIAEVRRVLIARFKKQQLTDQDKYSMSDWESVTQMVKNKDMFADFDDLDDLKIVHAFCREVTDGSTSHYIMPEVEARQDFMYDGTCAYEAMSNAFCPFLFNIGDGYMASVRGVGHRMYQLVQIDDRLINSTFDAAMMQNSMVLQNMGTKDSRLKRMGPVTILPDGAQPVQQSFAPNLNGVIAARSMLQQTMKSNHGQSSMPVDNTGMPQRTTTEVLMAKHDESQLKNFQIVQFYTHLDRYHRETFRRMVAKNYPASHPGYKERERFLSRCEQRGVPREILMDTERIDVRSMRAVGSGSPMLRQIALEKILSGSGMSDERGKKNVYRDWVASLGGIDAADRYAPTESRDQIPTTEHTLANLENVALSEGKPIVVGVDQLHLIHLSVQFGPLNEVAANASKALMLGDEPNVEQVLPYLEAGIPHLEAHIEYMAGDPRHAEDAKGYVKAIKAMINVYKRLLVIQEKQQHEMQKQMQEQAELMQQAQEQVQSDELKEKLAKVQADFMIRMKDVENKARIREYTAQHNAMLKEIKLQSQLRLDALSQQTGAR